MFYCHLDSLESLLYSVWAKVIPNSYIVNTKKVISEISILRHGPVYIIPSNCVKRQKLWFVILTDVVICNSYWCFFFFFTEISISTSTIFILLQQIHESYAESEVWKQSKSLSFCEGFIICWILDKFSFTWN